MKKVLMIGNCHHLADKTAAQLGPQYETQILDNIKFDDAKNYVDALDDVEVIYTFLGPWDVDLAMEAIVEALDQVHPSLQQFVMLSTAGIDNELLGTVVYPGVENNKEYLNQQRYAAKLVDEYEIPYTILRPVCIIDDSVGELEVIDEGENMYYGEVSADSVAKIAAQVVEYQQFVNQSVGLIER